MLLQWTYFKGTCCKDTVSVVDYNEKPFMGRGCFFAADPRGNLKRIIRNILFLDKLQELNAFYIKCGFFLFQADSMMSCPLPIVPVIQPLPTLNSQTDFPIHIGIKVSYWCFIFDKKCTNDTLIRQIIII